MKTTIFLVDMADFAAVNGVYASFMTDPPPARSTVAVAALPKGARVEIEAIAGRRPEHAVGGELFDTRDWPPLRCRTYR